MNFPFGSHQEEPGAQNASAGALARRRAPLVGTIVVIAVLIIGFIYFTQVYADVLWYRQLGYLEVFLKENGTRIALFLAGFLIMGAVVFMSLKIAYRTRPVYASNTASAQTLSRYQRQLEPARRVVMIIVPVIFGFLAGAALFPQWQTAMLFFFGKSFGQKDPQFGLDIGFYTNTLPFLNLLVGFLSSVVIVGAIAGIVIQYLYGGIRFEERSVFLSKAARIQIVTFAAIFLCLQAVNFWLEQYATLTTARANWTGAMYTDVNAVIPTKVILAIASVIVALLLVVTAVSGRWRFSVIGVAMLIVTMIVAGGAYPWVVQQLQVKPTEQQLESPYIQRNIDMTRQAYGLDSVDVNTYSATTSAEPGALRQDATTAANIRLMDPNIIGSAFNQLQQFRQYYRFPSSLSVDRYNVEGKTTDTVISARELNMDGTPDNWVNRVVNYTHGYGIVAASGSRVQKDGKPDFLQSGIPSEGFLGTDKDYEPRIYFGESSPEYSVVGAPAGAQPQEIDRPHGNESGNAKQSGDTTSADTDAARYTFSGNGGPDVGNWFNRLVYSIKFQSTDLLLSENVNSKSQILYDRNPLDRVRKVAPYLTVDSNMYPAVVDGRIKWMVDAYTTSSNYPYSTPTQLSQATRDALNRDPNNGLGDINYIRNAVKATVDAYDGSVTLYAWDDKDPILQAWQSVFPSSLKPYSQMSADVMSHVRYPEDQFKVQRELLGRYHVTNPDTFFQNGDAWMVPDDPSTVSTTSDSQLGSAQNGANGSGTDSSGANRGAVPGQGSRSLVQQASTQSGIKQPPYYLTLQMPGAQSASFSLTSPFIPYSGPNEPSRNVLYGFLAADGDAGSKAGVKSPDYGKLRLLELPRQVAVPGPGQAQNLFNSDPTVSGALNLLRQGASTVKNGNLLTLPIGGGMLYVQPVYVQSSGDSSYPTLQRVLVSFGEHVGFAPTLDEALDQVFGGDSGVRAQDADNVGDSSSGSTTAPRPTTPGPAQSQSLKDALSRASQALKDGQDALAKQDFAAYGEAQNRLSQAIQDAVAAEGQQNDGASPSPSGQPSPTATPTPGK